MRHVYIKPECQQVPFYAADNLLGIAGSTGAVKPFGKDTDFEEEDDNFADDDKVWTKDRLEEALDNKIDDYRNGSWRSL